MERDPNENDKNTLAEPFALTKALPTEKSEKDKNDEFINVFKYFENANIRNRNAFCELLDYTMENRRDTHK